MEKKKLQLSVYLPSNKDIQHYSHSNCDPSQFSGLHKKKKTKTLKLKLLDNRLTMYIERSECIRYRSTIGGNAGDDEHEQEGDDDFKD